jgi:Pyridoxamine 5'-phosphate oxidase
VICRLSGPLRPLPQTTVSPDQRPIHLLTLRSGVGTFQRHCNQALAFFQLQVLRERSPGLSTACCVSYTHTNNLATMLSITSLLYITALVQHAAALVLPPAQIPIAVDDGLASNSHRIPTVSESAVMARRILQLERIGTLSTIFPASKNLEQRPSSVAGLPLGLMDYYADCEPDSGNPTILALSIASSIRNSDAGSNVTLSLRWHPPVDRPYSAAEMPRFALFGYLEDISPEEVESQEIEECFGKHHPDSIFWMPGNRIHFSYWTRLVVEEVYWLGGFGDRAYIGWIPMDIWHSVKKEDIEKLRLPGETQ